MKKLYARVLPALALLSLVANAAFGQVPIQCTATHTNGPNSNAYIQSVQMDGTNDTLDITNGIGVTDHTDSTFLNSQADLRVGSQYSLNITGAGVVGAWIDYDQNGTLIPGEFLGDCDLSSGACTITFSVPCSAPLGPSVLRFSVQTDEAAGSGWETTPGICGTYTEGEDEDYVIAVIGAFGMTGLPTSMCDSEAPALLSGNTPPSGGSYSTTASGGLTDNGDGSGSFDPAGAGVGGPYTVTYTDACGVTSSSNVTVTAGTGTPSFTGLGGPYCPDAAQVALTPGGSGSFSGPGLTTQVQSETTCIYDAASGGGLPDTCAFTSNVVAEGSNPITSLETSPSITLTGATSISSIDFKVFFTACSGTSTFDFYVNGVVVGSWTDATNSCAAVGPGDFGYPYTHTATGAILDANWNFGGSNTLGVQQNNTDAFVAGYQATINYLGAGGTAFDPTSAGPGTHSIIYTESSGGCDNADVQSVTVLAPPSVSVGPDQDLCIGSTTTLTAVGGVSWTWNQGIGGGNNKVVGPTDTTEYVVTATDASGCVNTDTILVNTHPLPTAGFSGLLASYELCDPSDTLIGTPSGGSFSGTGVANNNFDPGAAGVGGPYTVTYAYTDGFGCMDDSVATVSVTSTSGISIGGFNTTHCELEGPVILEGLPGGGAFTGTGIDTVGVTDTLCLWDGTLGGNCDPGTTICAQNAAIVNLDSTGAFSLNNELSVESIEFLLYYAYDVDINNMCTGPLADWEFFVNGGSIGTFADTNLNCSCTPGSTTPLVHTISGGSIASNWNLNGDNNISIGQNSAALRSLSWKAVVHYTQPVFNPELAGPGGPHSIYYTFTSSGCAGVDSGMVTVNAAPTAVASNDTTICDGQSITLSGSGGTSQSWNEGLGNGSSHSVSPTADTEYILTTTAANGCTNMDTVDVVVNALPVVNFSGLSASLPDCATPDTLTGNPTGGTFSGTGVSGNQFNPASAGIGGPYTVTYSYTDGNGCTNTASNDITITSFTTVSFSGLNSTYCAADDLAALVGVPSNGTFSGPGLTNAIVSDTLCVFDHDISGDMDDCLFNVLNGCLEGEIATTALESTTVTYNNEVSIDRIEFLLYFRTQAGSPNFTFDLNGTTVGSFTSNDVHGSACRVPGDATYPKTVVVTGAQLDANWNFGSANTIGVQQSNAQTFVSGYRAIVFYEAGNIAAFDAGSAGVGGPYNIVYTVSDGTCSGTDTQTVTAINAAPTINAGADQALCPGGSVTLTATGGSSYTWNNGLGTGASHSVSPADTTVYIVTGTGANGCTAPDTVVVNPAAPVVANAGNDVTICAGDTANLTATGGTSYAWNNGLGAGAMQQPTPTTTTTYTVTATDANSCTATDDVTVTVNAVPQIDTTSMVVTDPPCGQFTGAINGITATGAGTVTYEWFDAVNSIATSASLTSIGAGTYTLVATDAVCNASIAIPVVNSGAPPAPTAMGGGNFCTGEFIADLTVTGSGGTYTWYNDLLTTNQVGTGVSHTPSQVSTSPYCVTETNAGCESLPACVTVTINTHPIADAGADTSLCLGESIDLMASGGSSYAWNNGLGSGATQTVSPTTNTTYTVSVTDAGCTSIDSMVVSVNAIPTADAGTDLSVCQGDSATLIGSGGLNAEWNTPAGLLTGDSITVAMNTPGNYSFILTVDNAGGCTDSDTATATVNATPAPNLGADQSICAGDSVLLDASSGGTTYTWNNGLGSDSSYWVSPTTTTDYSVTVSTAFACSGTDSVHIDVTALPVIDLTNQSITDSDCLTPTGSVTGITATASGTITYTWTDASNTVIANVADLTGVGGGGSYTLEVESNGCSAFAGPYSINNVGAPAAPSVATPPSYCLGDAVADITAVSTGGTITWYTNPGPSNPDGTGTSYSPSLSTVGTETYYATETVAGCESQATAISVTMFALPVANAGTDQVICPGDTAALLASGGTSYVWSTGDTTAASTASPAMAATYTVTVTDANGCVNTDDVQVDPSGSVTASAGSDVNICVGDSAMLTASGGTLYAWSTGASSATISVTPATTTTYTTTVSNSIGCSDTASVTVNVGTSLTVSITPDTSLCASGTLTLSASGGTVYTWSTGDTTANISVTPTATTTYVVSVSNTAGCTGTDSTTVTIGGGLTVTAGPDTTICAGGTAMLTATGGTSYAWNNGDTTATVSVSPGTATTYLVTVSDGNGCTGIDSAAVAIAGALTVTAGPDTAICAGGTAVLTATGGTNYVWNSGGMTASISVSPGAATTYIVTATDGNGCTGTDSATVTIAGALTVGISNDTTICAGETVTLTATGGATYAWSNSDSGASITVAPNSTTTYTVTATDANGCSGTASVVVTATPVFQPTCGFNATVMENADVTFVDQSTNGNTWEWDFGDGNSSTDQNPTNSYASNGNYTVTQIVSNDCASDTCTEVVPVFVGIGEIEAMLPLNLYPNPTRGRVTVELPENNQALNYIVSDARGRVVTTGRWAAVQRQASINLAGQPAGVYLLQVVGANGIANKRITLQH